MSIPQLLQQQSMILVLMLGLLVAVSLAAMLVPVFVTKAATYLVTAVMT